MMDDAPDPGITLADFNGFIQTKAGATGMPAGLLLKMAAVSIQQYHDAADRWQRLEYERHQTAPLWLGDREAQKLYDALRGQRGADVRLIRAALRDLFPGKVGGA